MKLRRIKMTNLSEVKKADYFLCLKTPLFQKGDLRNPNEKSAGLKEGGAFYYIKESL
jgi:hypothetical protein